MTAMVGELYDALRQAGVDERSAKAAASAVLGREELTEVATKADVSVLRSELSVLRSDVKADIADMKAELIKWNVGAMAVLTAIFAVIVRLS